MSKQSDEEIFGNLASIAVGYFIGEALWALFSNYDNIDDGR
jgi:hypothetical protein